MSGVSFDANWPRWIRASVNNAFVNALSSKYSAQGQIYIEGSTRVTNVLDKWIELRLTGPYFREQSGFFRVDIDYDVLVACNTGPDAYLIDRMCGDVAAAFISSIAITKFGLDTMGVDDGSSLGCLQLDTSGTTRGVNINHFGLIQPSLTIIQASVEGRYWMNLPG